MSVERNKDVIRRYVSAWSRGELQALSEFWSPDQLHHTRNGAHGYEETKKIVARFLGLFPEMSFQIDDMVAEGDRVVTRMTWRAPHKGDLMQASATSEAITCTVIGIARLGDGKIVEHWGLTDELALMAQMGAVPKELLFAMDQAE